MRKGKRFGSLVVLGESDRTISTDRQNAITCLCDCGLYTQTTETMLREGRRTACAICTREANHDARIAAEDARATSKMLHNAVELLVTGIRRRTARKARQGELLVHRACEICATTEGRLHLHHEAYDRPDDVITLCASCHARRHGRLIKQGRDPVEVFARARLAALSEQAA